MQRVTICGISNNANKIEEVVIIFGLKIFIFLHSPWLQTMSIVDCEGIQQKLHRTSSFTWKLTLFFCLYNLSLVSPLPDPDRWALSPRSSRAGTDAADSCHCASAQRGGPAGPATGDASAAALYMQNWLSWSSSFCLADQIKYAHSSFPPACVQLESALHYETCTHFYPTAIHSQVMPSYVSHGWRVKKPFAELLPEVDCQGECGELCEIQWIRMRVMEGAWKKQKIQKDEEKI